MEIIILLLTFAGTYLSLRSIFITRIKERLRNHRLEGKEPNDFPRYDKLIFRVFGLKYKNMKDMFIFNLVTLSDKQEEKLKKFFNYWEPFRAILYFFAAFLLKLTQHLLD